MQYGSRCSGGDRTACRNRGSHGGTRRNPVPNAGTNADTRTKAGTSRV